jgi:hypothetical protein
MHADEQPQRSPPEVEEGATTRELWLVRGSEHTPPSRAFDLPGPGHNDYELISADKRRRTESPAEIAAFQRRLRELEVERAETQAAREKEELRAVRERNRTIEEREKKEVRQDSRARAVALLRSIVLLIGLMWAVTCLLLVSNNISVSKITPDAVFSDIRNLITSAEAADSGLRRPPPTASTLAHTPEHKTPTAS